MWEISRVSESEEKMLRIEEWSAASVLAGIVLTGGHWPLATGESFPGPGPVVTSGHSHTDPQSRTETTHTRVSVRIHPPPHHHARTRAPFILTRVNIACVHACSGHLSYLSWSAEGQLHKVESDSETNIRLPNCDATDFFEFKLLIFLFTVITVL